MGNIHVAMRPSKNQVWLCNTGQCNQCPFLAPVPMSHHRHQRPHRHQQHHRHYQNQSRHSNHRYRDRYGHCHPIAYP